jgi:glycosyltransferase involved in cell wall biosynthesis
MTLPVTIIIPAFGRQAYLERAIHSIMDQRDLPERVIVVDDGSDSPISLSGLRKTGFPVELLRHQENRGAAAARNTGLLAAQSDWVSFLDSDDYWLPDSLTSRWEAMQASFSGGAGTRTVFGCGWRDVDPQGNILGVRWPRPGRSPRDFASGCWFSPGSCIFLNRGLALEVGLQDETLRRFEDVDWFLRLSLAGFTYAPARVTSVAITRDRRQRHGGHDEIARNAASRIIKKWSGRLAPALMRRLAAYMSLEVAASAHFGGKPITAAVSLARSFALAPRIRLQLSPGWESGSEPKLG